MDSDDITPEQAAIREYAAECRQDPRIQARTKKLVERIRSGNYTKVAIDERFKRGK